MDFNEVISLGIKIYGDENTLDGIYQLNGVEYIVCGNTVIENNC